MFFESRQALIILGGSVLHFLRSHSGFCLPSLLHPPSEGTHCFEPLECWGHGFICTPVFLRHSNHSSKEFCCFSKKSSRSHYCRGGTGSSRAAAPGKLEVPCLKNTCQYHKLNMPVNVYVGKTKSPLLEKFPFPSSRKTGRSIRIFQLTELETWHCNSYQAFQHLHPYRYYSAWQFVPFILYVDGSRWLRLTGHSTCVARQKMSIKCELVNL